ncbi:hypothetical protein [Metabacillus sp. RGM 3146]|uniref:hypothetical protein n=1 Tax=Metabacillus sp. RGM 3146 TaxID=3401092 RepID=UPI003B9DC259
MLKRKWLIAGTALSLIIPGVANAASSSASPAPAVQNEKKAEQAPQLNKEDFAKKHAEMKAELLKLVKTYTPEKQAEWNQAIKKQEDLRMQLKPMFEKHKEARKDKLEKWHKKGENGKMTEAEMKEKMAKWKEKRHENKMQKREEMKKFKEAVKSKDKAEIKKQLNKALDELQNRNKKMEDRIKDMDKTPKGNVQ